MNGYSPDKKSDLPDWRISDTKFLEVYTDDRFLQDRYDEMAVFVGTEDLVTNMWKSKIKLLSTVYDPSKVNISPDMTTIVYGTDNLQKPPRKIEVDFKLPKDVDFLYDFNPVRTFMYAADRYLMKGDNRVFASRHLTDLFQIDGKKILIEPTIPKDVKLV